MEQKAKNFSKFVNKEDVLQKKSGGYIKKPFVNLEVIEFYPKRIDEKCASKHYIGSMHVYIKNLDVDIRGIDVLQQNSKLAFYVRRLPGKIDDKPVIYPVFSFANNNTQSKFITLLKRKGEEFLRKNFPEYFKQLP